MGPNRNPCAAYHFARRQVKIKIMSKSIICKIFFLTTIYFVLAGCQTPQKFTEDFDSVKVTEGLTINEVIELIGRPQFQETLNPQAEQNITVLRYVARLDAGGGKVRIKELTLVFKDQTLMQKNLAQKIIMKHESDSRASNNVIQIN